MHNAVRRVTILAVSLLSLALAGCAESGPHSDTDHHGPMQANAQGLLDSYPLDVAKLAAAGGMHAQTEVQEGQVAPTVGIEVIADPMKPGNFNLHVVVTDFRFSPNNVSTPAQFGEGHTHVYVDDVLLGRAYGEWFHLAMVKPGTHTVKVTLNHNDHSEYAIDGKDISDSTTFTVA